MSAPFVVHSRKGGGVAKARTLEEAKDLQETLLGAITQDGVVVVEAVSS